jgi:hypothetical protein
MEIKTYHHSKSLSTTRLPVGKDRAIIAIKDIWQTLLASCWKVWIDGIDGLSYTPFTILETGTVTNLDRLNERKTQLFHPVVKDLVLLRSHREDSIESETILLRP